MKIILRTLVLAAVGVATCNVAPTSALPVVAANSDVVLSRRGFPGSSSFSSFFKGSGKPPKADFNRDIYYSTVNKKYWQPNTTPEDTFHGAVAPSRAHLVIGDAREGSRHIGTDGNVYAMNEVRLGRLNAWRFDPTSNALHHNIQGDIMPLPI